jgi:SpoVK/Ycf46/Vps4 family AAA+-type ATPase
MLWPSRRSWAFVLSDSFAGDLIIRLDPNPDQPGYTVSSYSSEAPLSSDVTLGTARATARTVLDLCNQHWVPESEISGLIAAMDLVLRGGPVTAPLVADSLESPTSGSAPQSVDEHPNDMEVSDLVGEWKPGLVEAQLEIDSVEVCLAELDALVGLAAVKLQVRRVLAVQQANLARKRAGQPEVPMSLHLVFSGPPGTGKTTVARIVARLYKAAGLLDRGHLVETDRSGLVGGYVGQTALKVQDRVREAHGGILFIDEAYSLSQGNDGYGREAVAALLKAMEDQRESIAVIAAGYRAEMDEFIESNPGLRSRFQTYIDFPPYAIDELMEIYLRMAHSSSIGVPESVAVNVREHLSQVDTTGVRGNGRYVRSLFESMFAHMAMRAVHDGVVDVRQLTEFRVDDIPRART